MIQLPALQHQDQADDATPFVRPHCAERRALARQLLLLTSVVAYAQSPGEEAFRAAPIGPCRSARRSIDPSSRTNRAPGSAPACSSMPSAAGSSRTRTSPAVPTARSRSPSVDGRALPRSACTSTPTSIWPCFPSSPRVPSGRSAALTLNCVALPPIGHPVGAFGHPWGFRFTGTRGITSAVTTRLGTTCCRRTRRSTRAIPAGR